MHGIAIILAFLSTCGIAWNIYNQKWWLAAYLTGTLLTLYVAEICLAIRSLY
jgi:hypothetical protein